MSIAKDKVVTFHYKLNEPGQEVFEDSHKLDPVSYLHGHNGMLKGVEAAVEGKNEGDNVKVTLEPEDAYGPVREDAVQRVSIKHIVKQGSKGKIKYTPGMVVQVNTANGPQDVIVVKSGLKNLDVNTNHPLAGKTLMFDIDITEVRDATEEELSHGHSHSKGGHQH